MAYRFGGSLRGKVSGGFYSVVKLQRCKTKRHRKTTGTQKPILQSAVIREVMYDALENMVGI